MSKCVVCERPAEGDLCEHHNDPRTQWKTISDIEECFEEKVAEIERLGRVLHCNWCGADVHSGPLWCANCSANNPVEKDRATLEARIAELDAEAEAMVELTTDLYDRIEVRDKRIAELEMDALGGCFAEALADPLRC
jgi:hypothetical protein